jgi:hypothetical protein
MNSDGGSATVHVSGAVGDAIPDTSVFKSLDAASNFFAMGSLGYSDTRAAGKFDGLELQCDNWQVEALDVDAVESSYFDNAERFPAGSVEFDCALLMRNIVHQWHGRPGLCCDLKAGQPKAGQS